MTTETEAAPNAATSAAVIPWRYRLQAYSIVIARGFAVGLLLYVAMLALFYGLGAAITAGLRLVWPWLAELPFAAAAGVTVVPVYFAWAVALILRQDRAQLAAQFSSGLGVFYTSNASAPIDATEAQLAVSRFKGRLTMAQFRAGFLGFIALIVFDQSFLAALMLYGAVSAAPEFWPFLTDVDATASTLGAFYLFFLQAPLDVALLGAPELYGFSLSALTPKPDAYVFIVLLLVFKVVLISEYVSLFVMMISIDPDLNSADAERMRQAVERDAGGAVHHAALD